VDGVAGNKILRYIQLATTKNNVGWLFRFQRIADEVIPLTIPVRANPSTAVIEGPQSIQFLTPVLRE
jgi:hypothetical protein